MRDYEQFPLDKYPLPEPKEYPKVPEKIENYNKLSPMQKEFTPIPEGYREFYRTLRYIKRENMDNYEWLLVWYEENPSPEIKEQIKQQVLKFEEKCPEETAYVKQRRKKEFEFYGRA